MSTKKNKYALKMLLFLLMDLAIAALIVFCYYWFTFRAPKKNVEPISIIDFEETTAEETTTEEPTEAVTETETEEEIYIRPSSQSRPPETETEEETESESETVDYDSLSWKEKFSEHFTDEIVKTEYTYSDPNVSIEITPITLGEGSDTMTYYVADIYVTDIRYFGTGIYNDDGTFQYVCSPELFAMENPSYMLFTNGDYCGFNLMGLIIRNGKLYRDEATIVDQCALLADGTMKIYSPGELTVEEATSSKVWQSWCFGPSLLNDDGTAKTEFPHEDYLLRAHPRTAIGYYEPGHYCLVVIDGREEGYSRGMTLLEMSKTFQYLGCKAAYNLDGGASSCMLFNGTGVNHYASRMVSDYVVVSTVPLS